MALFSSLRISSRGTTSTLMPMSDVRKFSRETNWRRLMVSENSTSTSTSLPLWVSPLTYEPKSPILFTLYRSRRRSLLSLRIFLMAARFFICGNPCYQTGMPVGLLMHRQRTPEYSPCCLSLRSGVCMTEATNCIRNGLCLCRMEKLRVQNGCAINCCRKNGGLGSADVRRYVPEPAVPF